MFSVNRFYSHLNSAAAIIEVYKFEIPFAPFIKSYFTKNKKFGSRDRKQITELCYCYFRLGKSFPQLSILQKILKGYQLSKKDWAAELVLVFQKYELPKTAPENIFPFKNHLSESIDSAAFEQSHLIQPDLFLRIRPGYQQSVENKLRAANIDFLITDNTVRLPNGTKIDGVLKINKEAVVQDYSSQKVSELLSIYQSKISNTGLKISVWDCCAASGGKSILAKDVLENIELTVSDIRPSILANLKKRFDEAGLKNYQSFVADSAIAVPTQKFDLIIADVPCSGSGTWTRTPEQLVFFDEAKINEYANLQKRIISNVVKYLKPHGYLLYITCSVFAQENEMQAEYLQGLGLHLIEARVLKGYRNKADTMYAVLMQA